MQFVPIKSAEQLDLQALHRIRSRLVGHRTAVINQLRGFLLECGVIVPQGPARLREILPSVLAQRTDTLPAHDSRYRRIGRQLWEHTRWHTVVGLAFLRDVANQYIVPPHNILRV